MAEPQLCSLTPFPKVSSGAHGYLMGTFFNALPHLMLRRKSFCFKHGSCRVWNNIWICFLVNESLSRKKLLIEMISLNIVSLCRKMSGGNSRNLEYPSSPIGLPFLATFTFTPTISQVRTERDRDLNYLDMG